MRVAAGRHVGVLVAVTMIAVAPLGCGVGSAVDATAVAFDQTTQALAIGELASVNGTYGAACTSRSGAWSVEIATGATLDNPALSVVLNDTLCVLTLTSLHTTAGIIAAVPTFALTTSYQATASAFGSPPSFYANARLSAVTFGADFVVSILFSDDPSLATADNTAQYSVAVATATAQSVPAPSYTLDVSGLLVRTDVNDVVQTVTGSASLAAGAVAGQFYVIVADSGLVTYSEIEAAYAGGTAVAVTATIAAASFTLVGVDLTPNAVRTLIVSNTANGITSYESFEITFHPAP